MSGTIFLIRDDGQLVEMREQPYDSEALLQELLAKHPSILAGDQINIAAPRRWLLVSREVGLPSEEGGGDRWSVDHLFLDQDAIPTVVEVKRSSDTRIRREVVGQMLDYAANAVVYWPIEAIIARFEATCRTEDRDPEEVLINFLGVDGDQEQFWNIAKTNLQAGKVRLVFVADQIPPELRRVVEFLNARMDPTEVLAVEVKQYVREGLRTLVPRVIGQTSEIKAFPPTAETIQWDEPSFFQELARRGTDESGVARRILQWAKEKSLRIWWGKGKKYGSFYPMLDYNGQTHWLISVWTNGVVQMQFQMMRSRPPFHDESKRLELMRRLNLIPGVTIAIDAIKKYPSIPLLRLKDDAALKQFLETLEWVIQEIKAS